MNQAQKNYYAKCIEREKDAKLAKLGMNSYGTNQHKHYSRYNRTDNEKAIEEQYSSLMTKAVLRIVKAGKIKKDDGSIEGQQCVISASGRHSYPNAGHFFDFNPTIDNIRNEYNRVMEAEDIRVTKLCEKIKQDAFKLTNRIMFDGATNLIELVEQFEAKEYV